MRRDEIINRKDLDRLSAEAVEDYKRRFENGNDAEILFMRELWGNEFGLPENIIGTSGLEDENDEIVSIDVKFNNDDHVACYSLLDGKLIFDGFES